MLIDKKFSVAAMVALLGAAQPAAAAETTADLGVSASVLESCNLSAVTALAFGPVATNAATPQITPGVVSIVCTNTKPSVTVSLDGGAQPDGTTRRMATSGGAFLPYKVHSDAGHANEISIGGTLYSGGVTAAVPTLLNVFGEIPQGNYSAGEYSDTIVVTLTY
jgi:spore coat protein U-like protein